MADAPAGANNGGSSNAAAVNLDQPTHVEGVKLAHVDITPTQAVEFWETQPGSVLMIQSWDVEHDTRLELDPLLFDAGGTFTGLYRKLMNDPNVAPSPELVAADERRRKSPIRDASLPPPAAVAPLHAPLTLGTPAYVEPASPPGAVKPLDISYNVASWDTGFCNVNDEDGSWCPPGAYNGFIYGNSYETIHWDAVGYNPQARGRTSDRFEVDQWVNGAGTPIFTYSLGPGHAVEAIATGFPATYQGLIYGTSVSFAERWRLSFPQVVPVATHPGDADGSWMYSEFSNDIQGITHDTYNTWMSRTEEGIGGPLYGVIGGVVATEDLGGYAPDRFEYPEPAAWQGQEWNHYGDIVLDNTQGNDSHIFVSLSNANGSGGIGVFDPQGYQQDRGAARVSGHELAWLARNPKNQEFYASKGYAVSIQRYTVTFPPPLPTSYPPAVVHQLSGDISLVNGPIDGIQGGKVSRHGKLWVCALQGHNAVIYGIDPYSALIETEYWQPIPVFFGVNQADSNIEVEGLDITDPNLSDDALIQSYRPGITGEIHVQVLQNEISDDGWSMLNFSVSDLDRL